VNPTGGQGPLTPPGAQASGPITSQGGTLPFTGLSLLKVVLVGVGLLLLGVLLRRGVPRRGPSVFPCSESRSLVRATGRVALLPQPFSPGRRVPRGSR